MKSGENILIAAHGNSLRALVMELDQLSRDEIIDVNIGTGEPYIYGISESGAVLSKEIIKS